MTQSVRALAALLKRFLRSVISGVLTPAHGVAPTPAGTQKPPIAGMPESSAQGGSFGACAMH